MWRGFAELVDRAWPRVPLALLGLSAVILVVALIVSPAPSDRVQIDDVVHHFGQAAADRRGDAACALLGPVARRQVVAPVPTESCTDYVQTFGVGFDAGAVAHATIRQVQIVGSRAAIPRSGLVDAQGDALGLSLGLERDGDGWRIAAFKRG